MIKFLIAFAAAPGMSRQACHIHYQEKHGPLVAGVPEFWKHVRGYVQNRAITHGSEASRVKVDGLSELWFNDWVSYDSAFAEPRYSKLIRPDEERFGDLKQLLIFFAEDIAIFGSVGSPSIKLFRFLKRAERASADLFFETWCDSHAAAVAADPTIRSHARAYIQNRPKERGTPFPSTVAFDGVDEFWFDSVEKIDAVMLAERKVAELTGMSDLRNVDESVEIVVRTQCIKPIAEERETGLAAEQS